VRSLPTIWHGIRGGLDSVFKRSHATLLRTDDDLPPKFVGIGVVGLLLAISLAPKLHMNLLGALLIAAFGFLFVTVSSRLTGEIGSSSNPISGMTIATLLFTCLIFLLLGWTGRGYYVTALSVGAIVCIAASNGGTTSQDLKTGQLIGATPRLQQIAILVGALASALLLGPILLKLNETATVYVPVTQQVTAPGALEETAHMVGPQADAREYAVWHNTDGAQLPRGSYLVDPQTQRVIWLVDPGINGTHDTRPDGTKVHKFDAPKATLMSYIIQGILDRQLPWGLVLFGVMIALVLELCEIPSLAFAVGVYLPISASTPILIGGLLRYLSHSEQDDRSPGVLMASGYIAGGAIAGIAIAFLAGVFDALDGSIATWASEHNPFFSGPHADGLALIPFALLAWALHRAGSKQALQ
jgi:uncharacterized oligopeptide transporter (OPT) family protein